MQNEGPLPCELVVFLQLIINQLITSHVPVFGCFFLWCLSLSLFGISLVQLKEVKKMFE